MTTRACRGAGLVALAVVCLLAGGAGPTHAGPSERPADTAAATRQAADTAAARNQWIGAQLLSGGTEQAVPLFLVVANLRRAISAGANRGSYTRAIDVAIRFAELPDVLTPAEHRTATTDFNALDAFFGFSMDAWAGSCLAYGPGVDAAARSWLAEPAGPRHGVSAVPLRRAADELARSVQTDTGGRGCYATAITDLDALESATAAELTAAATSAPESFTHPQAAQILGAEIFWLNDWFALEDTGSADVSRLAGPTGF